MSEVQFDGEVGDENPGAPLPPKPPTTTLDGDGENPGAPLPPKPPTP